LKGGDLTKSNDRMAKNPLGNPGELNWKLKGEKDMVFTIKKKTKEKMSKKKNLGDKLGENIDPKGKAAR